MSPSLVRTAVDRLEPAIGRPLEQVTASSEFALTLALAARLRRSLGRRVDAAASWALHQAALPSHADLRSVQRQVASLEREVSALRRQLDERDGGS